MLNQSHIGGATESIHYNSWLATVPTEAKPSGPENSSSWFAYADESGIEEAAKEREDDSLKWVADFANDYPDNLKQLMNDYPGKWIVVKNKEVVEISEDLVDVLKRASKAGIRNPLVLKMEPLPLYKWRTAF
jgi:Family of unknown function (DUF5678)